MRVVRKTRNAVPFNSLKIGDQFERPGDVYLKIAHGKKTPNAVILSGCGEARLVTFDDDVFVTPVTVELHVFDKGENP